MIKYHHQHFNPATLGENHIDRIQLAMIPANSRLLEIGCATGYMSEYLSLQKGCLITGVEIDPDQAQLAKNKCLTVINGAIDTEDVQTKLSDLIDKQGHFDVVFMSQVIEHLAEPEQVLRKVHEWLTPEGYLIISSCNIAHWRARLRLLAGKWQYEEYGLFDRGHLRFFTFQSFEKMLDRCGFIITESAHTFEDFCPVKLLTGKRLLAPSDILRCLPFVGEKLRRKYVKKFRNLIGTQFVYRARPKQNYDDLVNG